MPPTLLFLLLAAPAVFADVDRVFTLESAEPMLVEKCNAEQFYPVFAADVEQTSQRTFFGTEADREMLSQQGWKIVSETLARPFEEINAEMQVQTGVPGYDSPAVIEAAIGALVRQYPRHISFFSLNAKYKTPPTHSGREIFAIKISADVSRDTAHPSVLIACNHHARELITPQLALDTAQRLLAGYGRDALLTRIVDENQIFILYTMNPDGLAYVWSTNNMWRKNRHPNSDGTFGVDQNRNYPVGWDSTCAGSKTPSAEDYRGPAAGSEPETKTMLAFHADRNFAKVMDYHSYAREVRIPYGDCAKLPAPVDQLFINTAKGFADVMLGYRQARSCCMGGNIHSAYHSLGALPFLTETGTAFQPPAAIMREEVQRVWNGTLSFLRTPLPVSGIVTDQNGRGIRARLAIDGLTFQQGELFHSRHDTGAYHLWLPAGVWRVQFSAPDHIAVEITYSVPVAGSGLVRNVVLNRPIATSA